MSTCNFHNYKNLPILVFKTYDEVIESMEYDPDYPRIEYFKNEDDFWDAKDTFEENFFNNEKCCILTEEEIKEFKNDIENFNCKIRNIAYRLYDSKRHIDQQEYYNLLDVKINLDCGYYSGMQLYVDESCLKYINKTHQNMIKKFFEDMQKKYYLTRLYCNGVLSNGEAIYSIS